MRLNTCRQRGLLHRRELARPVTAARAGAHLAGAPPPDQSLVDVRHADPEQRRRSPRRQAAINRRQNPRPQILRIALSPPPPHRRPHSLWSGQRITLHIARESPFSDSAQSGDALAGGKLDCFYEYMNWYTSGFQGAFIARQGYYSSIPENAKKYLTEAEWDYWYGGKPAATDITDPYGKLMEKAGRTRDGGAAWGRMGNIAVWNTVMDEDRYLTRRWNEFITS